MVNFETVQTTTVKAVMMATVGMVKATVVTVVGPASDSGGGNAARVADVGSTDDGAGGGDGGVREVVAGG